MSQSFDLGRSTVLERFLRYARVNTQSYENSDTYPSSAGQLELGRLLVKELRELGLQDAEMDDNGYVMATLPATVSAEEAGRIPVIGLLAHLDTYHEVSGENVNPIVHRDYKGGDITLPGDSQQVITVDDNPELLDFVGDDIITSDGTTLLGADDKAGIAEIMAAVEYMVGHPEFKHGTVKIGFTPDEEVGNGTQYFDVKKFGADYAYTLDGGYLGEVENETFCADTATVLIHGQDVHPGYAKDKMINAVRVACNFVGRFRTDALPETTADREGYLHPYNIQGNVSEAKVTILVRDFEVAGLQEKRRWLETWAEETRREFPGAGIEVEVAESYRNMVYKLNEEPRVMEVAIEAVKRAGVKPIQRAIRGGTDGARLSYMGLLTPNLFAGGMNFHSKQEWLPLGAMRKGVETALHLVDIWRERGLS